MLGHGALGEFALGEFSMALDLDTSGPSRQGTRVYLGPSLGWTDLPNNIVTIVTGGATAVDLSTTLVLVNFNGAVTLNLPSSRRIGQNLGTLPRVPLTIVDIGGFASVGNITIVPAAGETIMSLASIKINVPFGSYQLVPLLSGLGWVQQ